MTEQVPTKDLSMAIVIDHICGDPNSACDMDCVERADITDQLYALLVRRGYAQHEAHRIAHGPSRPPSSERFREIPVQMDGYTTRFFINDRDQHVVVIEDELSSGELRLYVKEARGLRDWLNKVLP